MLTQERERVSSGRAANPAGAIPPDLLLRRDRTLRYERGALIYAVDGLVGSLKQVVVDQNSGEVTALVVRVDGSPDAVLMPPDLVDKTAGSAIFLTLNRAQIAASATRARRYDKAQFVRANPKSLLTVADTMRSRNPRRAIAQIGRDFVETAGAGTFERAEIGTGVRADVAVQVTPARPDFAV